MIVIHKEFYFSAAHQYGNPELDAAANQAAFGKDLRLHGHNYILTVSVTGPVNPQTGFLVDLTGLKTIVREEILSKLDHARIDQDIAWFRNRQPSTENLVVWIWDRIAARLSRVKLHRIRLQETPSIYTDYFGPTSGTEV